MSNENIQQSSEMSSKRKILITIAIFMAFIEILFLNGMTRTIGANIAAALNGMTLFTLMNTIFFLTSTLAMPISIKLGNKFGRRNMIIFGIAFYSVSMVLAGLSSTMVMHIVFRGGQGLGQGFMLANCLTAIGETHNSQDRSKYLGLYGTVAGICNIIAPTVGGFINDTLGWNWTFYAALPVGIIVIIILVTQMPNNCAKDKVNIDIAGSLLLAVAATSLVFVFSWGGQTKAWNSPVIISLIIAAVISSIAFVAVERKATEPIVPMWIFGNKAFTLCVIAACCIWPAMFVSGAYFTLYAQAIRGLTATNSAFLYTVMPLVQSFAGIIIGWAIAKRSGRIKEITMVVIILYLGGLGILSIADANTSLMLLGISVGLIGIGNGAFMGAFTTAVQNNLPKEQLGSGTATLQCFQSLTGTIGLSIMGLILNSRFAANVATAVPNGLTEYVPMKTLSTYLNPGALMKNAAARAKFAATLPNDAQKLFQTMMQNVNIAYAHAMQSVYVVLIGLVVVAFIAVLLLKEKNTQN